MLYVFLVDTGTMLAFDMNLALECVSQLKEVISRACKIPEDKQVLLISGGESLDSNARVCSYSAGTDTNPIFLFSKSTIESSIPPTPSIDYGSDADLREQVDGSLNLPPTFVTVVARSQLAQQFHDVAKELTRLCESLVHDQHLQQQGWAAVVANLEDISSAFKTRTEVFEQNFRAYLDLREHYVELLKNFNQDREILGRIPVLRTLLKPSKLQNDKSEEFGRVVNEDMLDDMASQVNESMGMSLLQWISSKDQQSSLEGMALQCSRGLEQFNQEMYDNLRRENGNTLESINNPSMKEVKGLEDRLYGLEQLMHEARKIVQEQDVLAQAFMQNQTRAGHLGDVSILPDLCASHRKQLMVMLQNHKQLQDIRRRCIRAKEELSVNLHARLRWIMYVERTMSEVDGKLVIYHENLKRLKRHLEVVHQIHLAPSVYFAFVVEVVRRRSFSSSFLQWSKVLSTHAAELYHKELMARKEFFSRVGNHFLYALFPGLEDFPPPYALQAPTAFDSELPDIRPSDVDALKRSLPEMASSLTIPHIDIVPLIEFRNLICDQQLLDTLKFDAVSSKTFIDESRANQIIEGEQNSSSNICCQNPDKTLPTEACAIKTGDVPSNQKDHDESEPDTEEFEQVDDGVAPIEADNVLEEPESEKTTQAVENPDEVQAQILDSSAVVCSQASPTVPSAVTSFPSCSSPALPTMQLLTNPSASLALPQRNNELESLQADGCAANTLSQDFFTADFYIDESMPSSYTESNGTGGAFVTGGILRGHMVKTHHVIVAELQNKLEEKGSAITQLQEEMSQSQLRIQRLEEKLKQLQALENDTIAKLRRDVADAREFVLHNRNAFLCHVVALSAQVSDVIEIVRERICSENGAVLKEALFKAKEEQAKAVSDVCHQLELESSKLRDACLEVERYQDQLQQGNVMIDSLKMEMTIQLKEQRHQLTAEHNEVIKSMTIEHELDLENLRESQRRHFYDQEEQIRQLQEELHQKSDELAELSERHSALEETLTKKIHAEKEEWLLVIEEGYAERERQAVKAAVEVAESMHRKEIERLDALSVQRMEDAGEELRQTLMTEMEAERVRLEDEKRLEIIAEVERCKKEVTELLNKAHRQEMEALRARCRYAFTTSMERSPSESSLEKIEKLDGVDSLRAEQQIAQLRSELQECLLAIEKQRQENRRIQAEKEDCLRTMQASFTAQKQVLFNEAIYKATSEKDSVIKQLREMLKATESELEKQKALSRMTASLPSLSSPSEEEETRSHSLPTPNSPTTYEQFQVMVSAGPCQHSDQVEVQISPMLTSIAVDSTQEQSASKLQLESSVSSCSTASSDVPKDKVSVFTCNVGDIVLICYDEKHENYIVFSIGSVYHFVNSDCLEALSLVPVAREPRKPWALAEITDKEYCEAKKVPNRYRVKLGTRFYRVKAKPFIHPRKDHSGLMHRSYKSGIKANPSS